MHYPHFRKRHLAFAATTAYMAAFPRPAYANNGLNGLGALAEMLAKILGGMTFGGFVISLINLSVQSVWLRIFSVILLLPALLVALVLTVSYPVAGIPALLIVLGLHWLAFKNDSSKRGHDA